VLQLLFVFDESGSPLRGFDRRRNLKRQAVGGKKRVFIGSEEGALATL